MSINLENLSPAELKALITNAQVQMQAAHANHVKAVREKIERLLKTSNLTLADVYPTRGGKAAKGAKSAKSTVAPKYRNPDDASQQWSGRGKRPLWFVQALKKRGTTVESLLIDGASKVAPAKAVKAKSAKQRVARKVAKTTAEKKA